MRVPNPRAIKINFPYLVHEIAKACKVTRGTVRRWRKEGLKPINEQMPYMFLGSEVRAFLESKRHRRKRPCGVGQIYCVRCHQPRTPAMNCVEFQPRTFTTGVIIGTCPDCAGAIFRYVSTQRIDEIRGDLQVRMVNCDQD